METQSKFLDIRYLETRLNEIPGIKRGEMRYEIENSDRADSKSLYIMFFLLNGNSRWQKYATLRISDHKQEDCVFPQFIVEPTDIMTKKKKKRFLSAVKQSIATARFKMRIRELKKL